MPSIIVEKEIFLLDALRNKMEKIFGVAAEFNNSFRNSQRQSDKKNKCSALLNFTSSN